MTHRNIQNQISKWLLIASWLPMCWLGAQAVHELGHVLGAWFTAGQVEKVILHPLEFSRTDLIDNPRPLLVAWAGPVCGITIPVLLLVTLRVLRFPANHLVRFFTGFCLVANGAYLLLGSFGGHGDAGDIIRHGGAAWTLWAFGLVTIPCGLLAWHRQGGHFGIGPDARPVTMREALCVTAMLAVVLLLECAVSPR